MASQGNGHLLVGMTLGGGPALVIYGLRQLQERLLLQNTPRSKVRSAAMGLVELYGQARPAAKLKAPLSGFECCWWRCVVQEWTSDGKRSSWRTIKTAVSNDPFYLEDDTGRVLINPLGASPDTDSHTAELDRDLRTSLDPWLAQWGIGDGFFSIGRRLRVAEQTIVEHSPLLVLGHLMSFAEAPEKRAQRLRDYVTAAKQDLAKMADADTDRDGVICADEWDRMREKLETEFLQKDLSEHSQNPGTQLLVRAPDRGPFVIAAKTESELQSSLRWRAPLAMLGGIALAVFGVFIALSAHWPAWLIVTVVMVGLVAGSIFKKGELSWFWQSW